MPDCDRARARFLRIGWALEKDVLKAGLTPVKPAAEIDGMKPGMRFNTQPELTRLDNSTAERVRSALKGNSTASPALAGKRIWTL